MSKELLLIDGSHMLHRAYHKYASMRTLDGEVTSMIYGFPFILRGSIDAFKPDKVIVIFDGKNRSKHRLEWLPNYKNRIPKLGFDKDNFVSQKFRVIEVLRVLGIPVAMSNEVEGDDLVWLVAKKYQKRGYHINLISGDKDFAQLVSDKFSQFIPHSKLTITPANFEDHWGFRASQLVDYLSLLGDSSDKIPGYAGMGEKRSKKFLEQFGSIKNYVEHENLVFGKLDRDELKRIWKLNKKLINIKWYVRNYMKGMKIPWVHKNTKFDKKGLLSIAKEFEIGTFMKTSFMKTFKEL